MKSSVLTIITVVVVLVTLVNFSLTLMKISDLRKTISGLASDAGYVNLTVESLASLNFSFPEVNFGSGKVDLGVTNATLQTDTDACTDGNWTFSGQKLILDNIGNVNLSVNLSAGASAASFIGGASAGGPLYQWNISMMPGETWACRNDSETSTSGTTQGLDLYEGTSTAATAMVCHPLMYVANNNSIRIDFYLRVPEDSLKGALVDTITATGVVKS